MGVRMIGNNTQIFCDTNILIYLLNGDKRVSEVLQNMDIKISFITELELFCKPNLTKSKSLIIQNLVSQCTVIEMNSIIKQKTIEIKQSHKIKLPDAIIAASAISLSLPIFTADGNFEKIPQLNLISFQI
ncbi:MAG: type II toxin-antitoxin system VapC family toxin [Chloroherpetonaceae bacterium]|nr:type II toxin-antitoxin system VapC family toxin [Chloroherpetonaceae bacterium]